MWAAITSAIMLAALAVATAVPFFDDLTSLIGNPNRQPYSYSYSYS